MAEFLDFLPAFLASKLSDGVFSWDSKEGDAIDYFEMKENNQNKNTRRSIDLWRGERSKVRNTVL